MTTTLDRIPLTKSGHAALEAELKTLKADRGRITEAIAEARAHGDLKENAEYHAAREQQSFCEGRIAAIESKLSRAQVIDPSDMVNDGKVIFGAWVTLYNHQRDAEECYRIVGDDEANVERGDLSYTSPLARSVVGKNEGDTADVKTPNGHVTYDIVNVRYTLND